MLKQDERLLKEEVEKMHSLQIPLTGASVNLKQLLLIQLKEGKSAELYCF